MAFNAQLTSFPNQAQDRAALRQVFDTITSESCPYSYNFHMHTVCSDGRLKPTALIEQALTIGLKGLAITDHHTVDGYQEAQWWLMEMLERMASHATRTPDLKVPHLWTGIEITSRLLEIEVHILGYAFNPKHPALQRYLQHQAPYGEDAQAKNVIAAIQAAGGLAVLAHPSRYRLAAEKLIPVAANLGIDGVETYYAYNNPTPWQPSPDQTYKVKQFSETYQLMNTCGTDTHGMSLLQRL